MPTNKKKSRIITITSWTFSLLGLIVGLLFLIGNIFGSIIVIFSALLIFPPTRKLYEKKFKLRHRFTYVLSFVLFFIGSMIVGLTVEVDPEALAESITRESPSESVQESLSPEVSFKYSCGFADDIYVNGEELSREDRKKLCDEGLSLTLSEGENSYELLFKTGDSEYKESVVIKFDSAAYELRLQEQEEEEQRKAEAQRIAKDDAAREAQEEAQAKMLADAQAAKEKLEAELEEKRQTIGYAVSGISMKEIREEYDKQKDMSDYKADKYLESLSGTQIVWVGEVSDVDEYILGNGNYIALSLSDSLLDFDMAFVDVIQEEDKNLNRGTLIQVSGKISRIDQGILGLSVYIKETSIEVLR